MGNLVFVGTNPDMSINGAEFFTWSLEQYLDRAGNFSGKAASDIPISVNGWLDVIYSGKIIHRGYIDSVTPEDPETDASPGTQSVVSKDLWALLDSIFAQVYEFPALTTINDLFSSDSPTPGKVLGLLYQLNSNLPQGEAVYTGANEIYKYAGYGTASRCSTNPIYVDTTLLTLGSSATALARGQYFRNSQDLWIRAPDGRSPIYWCVSIPNYRDTRIRRGTITGGTASFTVPFRIGSKTNFRGIIEKIILALNCEREMDHRAGTATVLGLTYLNLKTLVGRGSLTAPVTEFRADNVNQLNEDSTGGDVFNAIIAAGTGSGVTQICSAKSNMMSRGAWREKMYSSSVLGEILTASLAKIWADTSDPRCWAAKDKDEMGLLPGDYVGITPRSSQNLVKRVKKIIHRSDSTMDVEINQRILTAEDYSRAKSSLLSEFNSFISTQKTSWSSSFGPTNIDDSENVNAEFSGSAKFTINLPSGTIDTEFPSKFFLRFDIAAFEADTDSVDTAAHDNGGATGSHSGYGGGSTSAKTQTAHSVLANTTQPTGGSYATCSLLHHYHTHAAWSSSHSHGASSTYSNSWNYNIVHGVSHPDLYCSGVWTSIGGEYVYTTGNTSYASSEAWNVAGYDHTHGMPGHYTQDAGSQSHETAHEDAKGREVYTEPRTAALVEYFKTMKETGGSIHYLDVYCYLNGTQIDGSPFPSLYIGDSITDVDVTDQIIVGDNFLEFKIKEHYSSSIPVRCAIRGSINATYYINWNAI